MKTKARALHRMVWLLILALLLLGSICGKPRCVDLYPNKAEWEAAVEQAFADQSSIMTVDVFDPKNETDTLVGAAAILGCDWR